MMNAEQALSYATIENLLEEIAILKERITEARSKALDDAAKVVRFKLGLHFEDVAKAILSLKDTQT